MEKLLPIIVGAIIGIVPSIINRLFDVRSENRKWIRGQEAERQKRFQSQLASAGKKLLELQHAINWYVWMAYGTPKRLTLEAMEKYDAEVRQLFPEILSELVEIAVINEDAFNELDAVYQELVTMDAQFANIVSSSTRDGEIQVEPSEELETLFQRVVDSKEEVFERVRKSLQYNK